MPHKNMPCHAHVHEEGTCATRMVICILHVLSLHLHIIFFSSCSTCTTAPWTCIAAFAMAYTTEVKREVVTEDDEDDEDEKRTLNIMKKVGIS